MMRTQLARVAEGLTGALEELRELSRGIHPAILSEGGLGPALKALARRSAVPVELEVDVRVRLPEPVEVAAYYVVSEALANAAKHAHASVAQVTAQTRDGLLHLTVGDDGVGGASLGDGSGLVGLADRVEALGGRSGSTALPGREPGSRSTGPSPRPTPLPASRHATLPARQEPGRALAGQTLVHSRFMLSSTGDTHHGAGKGALDAGVLLRCHVQPRAGR
jgi:hypothetical protein